MKIKKNTVRFEHALFDFILLYLFVLTFAMKLKDVNYKSHCNYFGIFWTVKNDVRFEYVHRKNFWFCFISIVWVRLVIKLRDSAFGSHWNTLIFFNKRRYDVRFEYVRWKYVWWCCFIFIVWVYFSHETKKFRFSNSLKYFTLISFDKKKWYQIWISPVKHCLI